jgi:Tfp pilus assembly protein PilX
MRGRGPHGLADENGMALVIAVGTMLVLAIALIAVIQLAAGSARHASRSNAEQEAYALAEAGVNNGAATLRASTNPSTWPEYASLTTAQRTFTVAGNTVLWSRSGPTGCGSNCWLWTISATSSVKNPTGSNASPSTRAVAKQFRVNATSGSFPFGGSFLYSDGDVDFTGGSATQEAIIAEGNVLLGGGGWVDPSARALSVRGTIKIGNSNGYAGQGPTTALTANIPDATQNFANVLSTAAFPATGWIKIYNEYMTYAGKTATQFTGLTRGAFVSTAVPHAASGGDNIVSGASPPTLTSAIDASVTTIPVTSTAGFKGTSPCTNCPGMIKIANSTCPSGIPEKCVEYIAYTGHTATSFTGATRGYVPDFPAALHGSGAVVDGRLAEVHTIGGCIQLCGLIQSETPTDTNLLQDLPAWVNGKPTFNVAQAALDAAPGPGVGRQPSPPCTIDGESTAFSTSPNPYYNSSLPLLDLTPGTDYTCTATSPVYGAGQLSWKSSTKELTIKGVVFLPADAEVGEHTTYITPVGGATLYLGGEFSLGAGITLCGLRLTSTTCDTKNWNPNTGSSLALVSKNLPAWGATPAQTGNDADHPAHQIEFKGGSVFQGLVFTDGLLKVGGGGIFSGTAMAGLIEYGGGSAAPAPGVLSLPLSASGGLSYSITYVDGTSTG